MKTKLFSLKPVSIKLFSLSLLALTSTTQAFTVSNLFDASSNGSGWTGATADSQIIKTPGATPGTNEWFSRYTVNNGDSTFNINASILNDFKNAPMQDQNGAGLKATSSTVRASVLAALYDGITTTIFFPLSMKDFRSNYATEGAKFLV